SSSSSRSTSARRKRERRRSGTMRSSRSMLMSGPLKVLKAQQRRDGAGETIPIACFDLELLAAGASERIELGAAIVLARPPLRGDPPLLLELVQRGIERAVADLEDVGRQLFELLPDRPAIHRLEGEHLEQKEVQGALDEVGRLAHLFLSVTAGGYDD